MSDALNIGDNDRQAFEILSASAVRQAITACASIFTEQHAVGARARFDTSGGVVKRMLAGERPDIVASSLESLEDIASQGLLGGPPRVVGISRIALGMRRGEQTPDISTTDAFIRVLRAAPVIVRGDPAGGGTAGNHLQKVLERLGLVEELRARTVLRVGGYNVMKEVAEGRAPFGLTQSTEIVAVPGVEIVAWLPEELQLTTRYAVAAGPGISENRKAQEFLEFLSRETSRMEFDRAGFARP